jgi:hypothetical protein
MTIVLVVPLFRSAFSVLLPGVPFSVGRNAIFWLTPLTETVAKRWELSPFRYLIRIELRLAALLFTPLKVTDPPELPPI